MDYIIKGNDIDHKVMADVFEDPQVWLQNLYNIEVAKRRKNLMIKKMTEDAANPEVSNIPADEDAILESVFNADGYKTVAEKKAAQSAKTSSSGST
jgi:hypothetical protein